MRILITQAIDPEGRALLEEAGFELDERTEAGPIPRAELLERVQGCVGLLSMLTDRVDGEVLDAGPLRVVANHAVGVDNLDLEAARERGVVVCNTPGVLTEATADFAFALLLALARRVVEGDRFVREGRFTGWGPQMMLGPELQGATLGVVGAGRIGRAVARRAEAFGMRVLLHSRSGGPSLEELLAQSDVLSLHVPLTSETRHLIGAAQLEAMKPTALLINTARGPVVDEASLVEALRAGELAGAALDVFEREPEVHPGLLGLNQVVLAPHLGSATRPVRRAMARTAAEGLIAALGCGEPAHRVT